MERLTQSPHYVYADGFGGGMLLLKSALGVSFVLSASIAAYLILKTSELILEPLLVLTHIRCLDIMLPITA